MVSDISDKETPYYRQEWQRAIRLKRVDIVYIWEVFGPVITIGSQQKPPIGGTFMWLFLLPAGSLVPDCICLGFLSSMALRYLGSEGQLGHFIR
jgi:hypothetical protein